MSQTNGSEPPSLPSPQHAQCPGSGVYLGRPALDRVDQAQRVMDEHLAQSAGGLCAVCQVGMPCPVLTEALEVLGRYGRLPRRRPGATGAGAAGNDRTGEADRFGWF